MSQKSKLIVDYCRQRDDPTLLLSLMRYTALEMNDLQTICSFTTSDWWDFGCCQENELMANRKPEDWDTGVTEEDTELLSKEYFAKVSKGFSGKNLSYDLYLKMRFLDE